MWIIGISPGSTGISKTTSPLTTFSYSKILTDSKLSGEKEGVEGCPKIQWENVGYCVNSSSRLKQLEKPNNLNQNNKNITVKRGIDRTQKIRLVILELKLQKKQLSKFESDLDLSIKKVIIRILI